MGFRVLPLNARSVSRGKKSAARDPILDEHTDLACVKLSDDSFRVGTTSHRV